MAGVKLDLMPVYSFGISILWIQRGRDSAKDRKAVHNLSTSTTSYLGPFLKALAIKLAQRKPMY